MDVFGSIYLCPLRYPPQCSELTDCPDPEIIHSLGRRHFPNKLKGSDSGYQEWGLEGEEETERYVLGAFSLAPTVIF